MKRPLYVVLAMLVDAGKRCIEEKNDEWSIKHLDRISKLVEDHMPSGSGFNNGTEIDLYKSSTNKLVFYTNFQHMDDNGFYAGWTHHTITVKPEFGNINIHVSGKNKNNIKDHIHSEFSFALMEEIEEYESESDFKK